MQFGGRHHHLSLGSAGILSSTSSPPPTAARPGSLGPAVPSTEQLERRLISRTKRRRTDKQAIVFSIDRSSALSQQCQRPRQRLIYIPAVSVFATDFSSGRCDMQQSKHAEIGPPKTIGISDVYGCTMCPCTLYILQVKVKDIRKPN